MATLTQSPAAAASPSSIPSPTPNRPAHDGAPAIDEPYWLLFDGTSTATVTAEDGTILQTDRSDAYRVLEGGSLEGTVLIDGEWIGSLEVTETEGEAIPGLDPIEQQYGAQIDDVLPPEDVLERSPNPNWTRTTQHRTGIEVYIRVPADAVEDVDLMSEAFWWEPGHVRWYRLSVTGDGDFEAVLSAILGPAGA